jgi:hypothetical protein
LSGKSNLTTAAAELLCALGQANASRPVKRGRFYLDELELSASKDRCHPRVSCPQHIALNHVDISANKEAISNALSRIRSLSISVSPCEQIGDVVEGTRAVLQVLFVNHRIRRLCLDLLDRKHPKLMESDQLPAMIIDTQRCTRLRTLDISGRSTDPTRGDIVRMLEPHTASLRELYLFIGAHTKNHQLSGATNCREAWRSVLQTSLRCTKLSRFDLCVNVKGSRYNIDIKVAGEGEVAATLTKLAVCPTKPGKELGWVKG